MHPQHGFAYLCVDCDSRGVSQSTLVLKTGTSDNNRTFQKPRRNYSPAQQRTLGSHAPICRRHILHEVSIKYGRAAVQRRAISRARQNETNTIDWKRPDAASCPQNRPDRGRRLHGGVRPHGCLCCFHEHLLRGAGALANRTRDDTASATMVPFPCDL